VRRTVTEATAERLTKSGALDATATTWGQKRGKKEKVDLRTGKSVKKKRYRLETST